MPFDLSAQSAFKLFGSNIEKTLKAIMPEWFLKKRKERLGDEDTKWSEQIRSEEHTSELQSRGLISYAVFCLKKKNLKKFLT